jgi:phosphonate transport system ATP-binding protein
VALARRYCDRVLALRDGRLIFDGPTSALTPDFLRDLYGSAADELLSEPDAEPPADRISTDPRTLCDSRLTPVSATD